MCHIPLITPALNIINKYSVHNQATGRLLPVLSNQKMNAYLKEIAAIVGINKNLTTHCARHKGFPFLLKFNSLQNISA